MNSATSRIKDAIDIVSLIGEHLRLDRSGSVYKCLCPFHDDHKPSMVVNPEFQNYRCWSCGAHGDIFTFVQEYLRLSFVEAKALLAERAGIPLDENHAGRSDPSQATYRVLAWAAEQFQNWLHSQAGGDDARAYLSERGLTMETAREHGLGYSPPAYEWLVQRAKSAGHGAELLIKAGLAKLGTRGTPYDVFRGRLLFPIRDERKRILGFGGRILPVHQSDQTPKYLNTPATDIYNKSEVLYGLDVALAALPAASKKVEPADRAVVVMEGYTDCLMAYQHGFKRAVATCGTALTDRHVNKLRAHAERVVLMFDGDAAGQKAASEATGMFLRCEVDLRLCVLPDGLDPCDFLRRDGAEALEARLAKAPSAFEFVIERSLAGVERTDLEGRRRALDRVLSTLAQAPALARESARVKMDLAISRLVTEFGVEERRIRERLAELRQGPSRSIPVSSGATDEAAEPAMKLRERQIVQWLVARPSEASEVLAYLEPGQIEHPRLRRLAEVAQAVAAALGEDATADDVRDRLEDAGLARLFLELVESAPHENDRDDWREQIRAGLVGAHRKQLAHQARRLAGADSVDEHLKELLSFRNQSAG